MVGRLGHQRLGLGMAGASRRRVRLIERGVAASAGPCGGSRPGSVPEVSVQVRANTGGPVGDRRRGKGARRYRDCPRFG